MTVDIDGIPEPVFSDADMMTCPVCGSRFANIGAYRAHNPHCRLHSMIGHVVTASVGGRSFVGRVLMVNNLDVGEPVTPATSVVLRGIYTEGTCDVCVIKVICHPDVLGPITDEDAERAIRRRYADCEERAVDQIVMGVGRS